MTKLRVSMLACDLDDGHDLDVEIEAYASTVQRAREAALSAVCRALPNHVWYRWSDPETGDNGRNQDVFPWESEDWDENPDGTRFYEDSGHPIDYPHGPAPLYQNDIHAQPELPTL